MAKTKTKTRWRTRAKKRWRKRDTRFPLSFLPAIIVPAGSALAGASGVHTGLIAAFQTGDPQQIANELQNILPYEIIGYAPCQKKWHFDVIARNLGLIIGGVVAHSLANKLGLNRQMRKVPWVGKHISI